MEEILERRRKTMVPGGMPLHRYANLYVCARNPMLSKRLDSHASLTVLRIDTRVLALPGVVIAAWKMRPQEQGEIRLVGVMDHLSRTWGSTDKRPRAGPMH